MSKTSWFQIRLLRLNVFVFFVATLETPSSVAMDQCTRADVADRTEIGLVLGGGGARGYAHTGVLKKLERRSRSNILSEGRLLAGRTYPLVTLFKSPMAGRFTLLGRSNWVTQFEGGNCR